MRTRRGACLRLRERGLRISWLISPDSWMPSNRPPVVPSGKESREEPVAVVLLPRKEIQCCCLDHSRASPRSNSKQRNGFPRKSHRHGAKAQSMSCLRVSVSLCGKSPVQLSLLRRALPWQAGRVLVLLLAEAALQAACQAHAAFAEFV